MGEPVFVYEAIRTPRARGKANGRLNEVKPIDLVTGLLGELRRQLDFDTARVDDLVMGRVSPVGEQGGDLPKNAIGFSRHTGGALQYIRCVGLKAFKTRATELENKYGERFHVTDAALARLGRAS